MRCLSLGIIYILMQVRYNADIRQAARTDSAYCFDLCYSGIDVGEKSSCNFKFHSGDIVLENGSIAGSIGLLLQFLILCVGKYPPTLDHMLIREWWCAQ